MALSKKHFPSIAVKCALLGVFCIPSMFVSADLNSAVDKGIQRLEAAQKSQIKIDKIDDQIRQAERDYRAVVKEIDGLNVYIEQLNKQLAMQQKEISDIATSIEQVTLVERQIMPLMLRMIDSLDQFVNADVPFQIDERINRVNSLKNLMGRSDVTVAEKYRKVTTAFQAEVDYGRTIDSYRGSLNIGSGEREVDFLRVGRIALMYQSLDGADLGLWNTTTKQWQVLESSYKSKLMAGIRIAREQAAPDLIKVPLAAPIAVSTLTPISTAISTSMTTPVATLTAMPAEAK